MTVPKGSYKTVTDAWEGYHSIPLDTVSSKLYRYLTNPQGNHLSGDVQKVLRQVNDSLL